MITLLTHLLKSVTCFNELAHITASPREEEEDSREQSFGKDMIHLVGGAGRRKKQKKGEEKRKERLPVYRYRDIDLLSCIPLLVVQPVLREESDARYTPGGRKKGP